jgi:hypothetical protein
MTNTETMPANEDDPIHEATKILNNAIRQAKLAYEFSPSSYTASCLSAVLLLKSKCSYTVLRNTADNI